MLKMKIIILMSALIASSVSADRIKTSPMSPAFVRTNWLALD